ncbi:MAG: hypothetical protein R3326_00975 [Gemmatimonadota bacterium]|nr:hypothetical protein [Gemmatimonadota bacterium]
MAEPVVIIRENGLVIEVDLGNERCNPPGISPANGQNQVYEIRWSDADFEVGDWEVSTRQGPKGGEEAVLRWKRRPGGPGRDEEEC